MEHGAKSVVVIQTMLPQLTPFVISLDIMELFHIVTIPSERINE